MTAPGDFTINIDEKNVGYPRYAIGLANRSRLAHRNDISDFVLGDELGEILTGFIGVTDDH